MAIADFVLGERCPRCNKRTMSRPKQRGEDDARIRFSKIYLLCTRCGARCRYDCERYEQTIEVSDEEWLAGVEPALPRAKLR